MRKSTCRAKAGILAGILAALVLLAGPPVYADELLVMPFSCRMAAGQPLLTRAPEQSHRIIGRREQRTFATCSPANPDMCRNWTVHRFDIDCEGTRVSWVDVVAAAAEHGTGQAWAENGRLMLRMPRSWSYEPDDPCARRPGLEDRFLFGRMRRYCEERAQMAPPIVEMPLGFAPVLGIDAIFVQASAPAPSSVVGSAGQPAPPPAVAAQPKVIRVEPPPRPEPAPQGEPEAKEALAKAERQPQAAIKAPAQATAPPAPAVKPPQTATPPAPAKQPQAALSPASPGGPVIPKIINRPDAADGSEPPSAAAPAPEPAPAPKAEPATAAPEQKASPAASPPEAIVAAKDTPAAVNLLSYARSPTAGAIAALGGLAIVMLAAIAVARRRERGRAAGPPPHDFASVSLDGPKGSGGSPIWTHGEPPRAPRRAPAQLPRQAVPVPRPAAPAQPRAYAPQTPEPAHTAMAPALIERIPQTRAEAIQMLGVGVMPDSSETAMKKIVDGLRLSWHPDLAKNEADRQLREFRIKQINAAWDLIRGRRMERLDS